MMFELLDPYLAFRRVTDDKIFVAKIDEDTNNKVIPEYTVPLKYIFTAPEDITLVNFFAVPKSAYQTVRYLKNDGALQMYDNLLQVVVENYTIIFDL